MSEDVFSVEIICDVSGCCFFGLVGIFVCIGKWFMWVGRLLLGCFCFGCFLGYV